MGVSLDSARKIAGYRPTIFKNALRSFFKTQSPSSVIDLRSVFSHRRDGAIVFEECLERGLIRGMPDGYSLTEFGESFAAARVVKRSPLYKAHELLDHLIHRADILNYDPTAVSFIDQIWLFGSVMRQEETIGDIDAVIIKSRRPEYAIDHDRRDRQIKALFAVRSDVPRNTPIWWSEEDWLVEKALFGARRHPLFAGIVMDNNPLESLGVPCQLIYDRTRGGRTNDPILPRHPHSQGRSKDAPPIPDIGPLLPCGLRPMDGRWIAAYCDNGIVSPCDIFRGWTDAAHNLFPHYPEGLRVLTQRSPDDLWTPKSLIEKRLDGRDAIALVNMEGSHGTSMVLRRKIEYDKDDWILTARFEQIEIYRNRKKVPIETLRNLVSAAALILSVDVERMLRRKKEMSLTGNVYLSFDFGNLNEPMYEHFACDLIDVLRHRVVAIEPDAWKGSSEVMITTNQVVGVSTPF